MALSSARHKVTGTARRLLLQLIVLLMMSASAQSKYASGERRSGKKLVNQTALMERQVLNRLHCLALCGRCPDCHAFNFGAVSPMTNCQLLAEGACSGHPLVADSAVDYYDVYAAPTVERRLPHWKEPSCIQDGYCAVSCAARDVVSESCFTDDQCQRPELPAGTFRCRSGVCQREEVGFWEARPGLQLPRWMSWTADKMSESFKRLKTGQCELDIRLKLGVDASWLLLLISDDSWEEIVFEISGNKGAFMSADYVHEPLHLEVSNPTVLANSHNFTHLKLSWCNGLAMGPVDNPNLLNITQPLTLTYHFVVVESIVNESWMYIDSGVADPWLFKESGTESDPVFEISGPWNPANAALIGRYIDPANDVTLKYDCMAKSNCHAYFYLSTSERLKVGVGSSSNTAYSLTLQKQLRGLINKDCCKLISATPVCIKDEFVTFTIRYNRGHVTVFRNNDTEPAFSATTPEDWLPRDTTTVTRVALGHRTDPYELRRVRVARYDDNWATDTWLTTGTGFSSMAFERP